MKSWRWHGPLVRVCSRKSPRTGALRVMTAPRQPGAVELRGLVDALSHATVEAANA
jgi:hypothetical protein